MRLVIEIDEIVYEGCALLNRANEATVIEKAIANGIPLTKGHSDLVDADATFTKLNERIHVVDAIIAAEHGQYINNEIPLWMWSAIIEDTTIIKADKE